MNMSRGSSAAASLGSPPGQAASPTAAAEALAIAGRGSAGAWAQGRGSARAAHRRCRPLGLRHALGRWLPDHGPDRQRGRRRIAVRAEGRGRRLRHLRERPQARRRVDPATPTLLRSQHRRRRPVLEDRPDAPGLVREHRGADLLLLGQRRPVHVLWHRSLAGLRSHDRQEEPGAARRGRDGREGTRRRGGRHPHHRELERRRSRRSVRRAMRACGPGGHRACRSRCSSSHR